MGYRDLVQEWTDSLNIAARHPDRGIEAVKTTIYHYAPKWLDVGTEMDRLAAENARLRAIVDLIELKNERDRLAAMVPALHALADMHTRDDPQVGFVVETQPSLVEWGLERYISAWRTIRVGLNLQTEPDEAK